MSKTLDEIGLEVTTIQPKIGDKLPIYGMITKILSETETGLVVELNYNLKLTINDATLEKIKIIKERIFEPGIFISEITRITDNQYEATSITVIFGQRIELDS